ncbi:hypothetical protein [Dysgonomonas sp. GY617]|uniref:hypothetical protein n=1 Tax=Dysgonomonas sp. GY617 TaxID=2780420 RepID=UPI0018839CE1|nr:hypothetical protein [Dysgonomonas sp. GY617]MBF0577289.1 hypothetical protein [Dysgonomonas sp. GY617]
MDSRLENIVNKLSSQRNTNDPLDIISYAVNLETVLQRILSLRYLDNDSMTELETLGVSMIAYIIEYKNIKKEEAKDLIDYKYITSDVVLDVLDFILDR